MADDSLSPRQTPRSEPAHAGSGADSARTSDAGGGAPLPTAGFWDHLDELRRVLLRILGVTALTSVAAFACKRWLFAAVLAPARPDFVLWRLLARLSGGADAGAQLLSEPMPQLISTQLTSQLLAHMTAALYAGVLLASPYIVWQLFGFVSPALYERERRRSVAVLAASGLCFFAGTALAYWVIFPFSFRFLAAYQVSEQVVNTITLASYMDTLLVIVLMMGVMFQLPVAAWFCARMGILTSRAMRARRRHALFVIVALAAVITPTTDVFTLAVVSLPIMVLYQLSIAIVARAERTAGH